jgi:hypothetical protein
MIGRRFSPCVIHRASLIDFVDRGQRGQASVEALRHLDRCRACEVELTDIALAIASLRRLGQDLAAVDAPTDAWPTLRSRLARRRRPAIMSPISGMALSVALVAAIVLPRGAANPASAPQPPSPTRSELVVELTFIRTRKPIVLVADLRARAPRPDPYGAGHAQEEVTQGPSAKAPEAI